MHRLQTLRATLAEAAGSVLCPDQQATKTFPCPGPLCVPLLAPQPPGRSSAALVLPLLPLAEVRGQRSYQGILIHS